VRDGLLIVNADDWGGAAAITDAIERCFAAGAITSATTMVHMADSDRAAELAVARGRPIGLHLNLDQAFDGPGVPPAVRARHDRVRAHFADLPRRRWTWEPRVHGLVRAAVADQLEAFRALYAREPTHVDSHHHAHVCPDAFLALPRGVKARTTLTPRPGSSAARVLAYRAKHAALRARLRTTASFHALSQLHPDLGGGGLEDVVAEAARRPVEVMCHPGSEDQLAVLLTPGWRAAVDGAPLGSYAAL